MSNPELSVVVPVFNEAGNIEAFLRRLAPILHEHVRAYEVIFAVDPSTDGTEAIIRACRAKDPSVKMLRFSRRFGQPTATLAGIEVATGDAVVVMDVDLQDPPELLVEMLAKWRDGYDVVYAQRRKRTGETLVKRIVAKTGYALINRFAEVPIPRDTGDFRLLDRRVVDQLDRFKETHGFLRGLVALVGFEQTAVEFDRPPRHAGEGNYNRFTGSLRIGINGLVAFSSRVVEPQHRVRVRRGRGRVPHRLLLRHRQDPRRRLSRRQPDHRGAAAAHRRAQLICIGILGQYAGRIYEEVKQRPRYIVAEAAGIPRFEATNPPRPKPAVRV